MSEFITSSQGAFFVQDDWRETFEFLTCVGVGDLPRPSGDLTPSYCPDPSQRGKYQIDGWIQGEPGAGTTTLERPLSSVFNWLLENDCEFQALVTLACRGQPGNPQNFDVAVILHDARSTNTTIMAPIAREPSENARVMTSVDISYTEWSLIYQLTISQQSLDNVAAANDVAFLPKACDNDCSDARALCTEGYLALDGAIYNSEIKYTVTGGSCWEVTDADPFALGGDDTSSVIVVETSAGHRAIVAKGSNIGDPAEISYTEDWGANWTNVYVGAINGQTIQQLFYYKGNIWAACSGGYIYMSTDLAETWATQEAGTETPEIIRDICMYTSEVGFAVGDNNAFLYTLDGGNDWNLRIGPLLGGTLNTVAVNDKGYVFVGASDGALWYSTNNGTTWVQRRDFGVGNVNCVRFDTKFRYFGGLVYDTATPVGAFYRSVDGGASWQAPAGGTPDNNGLNKLFICDQNNFFIVGELDDGGNTFVAKVSPIT